VREQQLADDRQRREHRDRDRLQPVDDDADVVEADERRKSHAEQRQREARGDLVGEERERDHREHERKRRPATCPPLTPAHGECSSR
jgi:hypothetical protein